MDEALETVRREPDATRHLLHLLQQLQHLLKRQPAFDDPCGDITYLVQEICTLVHAIPEPLRTDLLKVTVAALSFRPWKGHNPYLLRLISSVLHQILALLPHGHDSRQQLLADLNACLHALFKSSGSLPVLEEAITYGYQALQLCSIGHPDKAHSLKALGSSLHLLCQTTGKLDALEEAIELKRQSLDLCPPGHANRSHALKSLGSSLFLLCKMTGKLEALEEGIGFMRQSAQLCPPDHADRARTLKNLGTLLFLLCQMTGKVDALEEAIELKRQSVQLCPPDHADRSRIVKSLGISLSLLGQMTGKLDALKEGIELMRQSLQLCPPGHTDRSHTLNGLGGSLLLLCQMTGKLDALEESIELKRQSLELCPPDHTDRSQILKSLAGSLHLLCLMTGKLDALEETIELMRKSLQLCPLGHADRAHTLKSLGSSLLLLCQRTGKLEAMEESIELMRQSLQLCPPDHADRAHTLRSLGISLFILCRMTGKLVALEESIEFIRQSLQLCPPGHVDRALTLKSLADSLFLLCQMTGELEALVESIELDTQSLQLWPPDHPGRVTSLRSLGTSLGFYYQKVGNLGLNALEVSIDLGRQSLQLCPPGHADRSHTLSTLGRSYYLLFLATQNMQSLEESISLQVQAIQYSKPASLDLFWASQHLGDIFLTKYSHIHEETWLEKGIEHAHTALSQPMVPAHTRLGEVTKTLNKIYSVLEQQSSPRDLQLQLFYAFSEAVHLLPYAAYFGLHRTAQLTVLHNSEGLGSRTCMLALLLDKPQEALELFEEAHGVFWLQALKMRSPLDSLPVQEQEELTHLFQLLEAGIQPHQDQDTHWQERQTAHLRRTSAKAEAMVDHIRKRDGFHRFLLPPLFSELAQVAVHGPVVVLVSHNKLSEALVILDTQGSIKRVPLPGVSSSELRFLGQEAQHSILRNGQAMNDQLDAQMGLLDIDASVESSDYDADGLRFGKTKTKDASSGTLLLDRVWVTIVHPIIKALQLEKKPGSKGRPRVHWCATGPFAFVPLHAAYAAMTTGARCSNYLISSYTPTLTALLNARRGFQPMPLAEMTALLVAVQAAPNMRKLTEAVKEVEEVENILSPMKRIVYGTKGINSTNARVDRVIDALPAASFFHLASHGQQDMEDPIKSAFCLQDGKLTIEALMKLDLKNAFFAYLGACETAKGDEKHRDQVVHLAAAMLFVGFRSIIGTMWEMNDGDGPFVAKAVYSELVKKEVVDLDDIPYALDVAVEKLRKRGGGIGPDRWAPYIHMGA